MFSWFYPGCRGPSCVKVKSGILTETAELTRRRRFPKPLQWRSLFLAEKQNLYPGIPVIDRRTDFNTVILDMSQEIHRKRHNQEKVTQVSILGCLIQVE